MKSENLGALLGGVGGAGLMTYLVHRRRKQNRERIKEILRDNPEAAEQMAKFHGDQMSAGDLAGILAGAGLGIGGGYLAGGGFDKAVQPLKDLSWVKRFRESMGTGPMYPLPNVPELPDFGDKTDLRLHMEKLPELFGKSQSAGVPMQKKALDIGKLLEDDTSRTIIGALLGAGGLGGLTALSVPENKARARRQAALSHPDDPARQEALYQDLAPTNFQSYGVPLIAALSGGALGAGTMGGLPILVRELMKNASHNMDPKTAFDVGAKLGMVKRALDWSGLLQKIRPYLVGGGLGGGLGLLAGLPGMLGGGEDETPEQAAKRKRNFLLSILTGAGVGAGGYGLYDYLKGRGEGAGEAPAEEAPKAAPEEAPAAEESVAGRAEAAEAATVAPPGAAKQHDEPAGPKKPPKAEAETSISESAGMPSMDEINAMTPEEQKALIKQLNQRLEQQQGMHFPAQKGEKSTRGPVEKASPEDLTKELLEAHKGSETTVGF